MKKKGTKDFIDIKKRGRTERCDEQQQQQQLVAESNGICSIIIFTM